MKKFNKILKEIQEELELKLDEHRTIRGYEKGEFFEIMDKVFKKYKKKNKSPSGRD